jgi:hypothetical protein
MAADWLAKLGRKGFEVLVADLMEKSIDKALRDRVEPRLLGIENRLAAIETRLDIADRLAKLEAEFTVLKSAH